MGGPKSTPAAADLEHSPLRVCLKFLQEGHEPAAAIEFVAEWGQRDVKQAFQGYVKQLNQGRPVATILEEIAEAGFWRIGLAGDASTELKDALGPKRVALVLGAEGAGMRTNTREHCDALARLPISDAMESLNVSNAAAVALYAASVA